MVAYPNFSQAAGLPVHNLIPGFYRPPHGLPLYWRDEMTGVLPAAVTAYIDHLAHGGPAPSAEQLALLWDYVNHHINAPCWVHEEIVPGDAVIVAKLRALAAARGGVTELRDYVNAAIGIALDPF